MAKPSIRRASTHEQDLVIVMCSDRDSDEVRDELLFIKFIASLDDKCLFDGFNPDGSPKFAGTWLTQWIEHCDRLSDDLLAEPPVIRLRARDGLEGWMVKCRKEGCVQYTRVPKGFTWAYCGFPECDGVAVRPCVCVAAPAGEMCVRTTMSINRESTRFLHCVGQIHTLSRIHLG